MNKQYIEKITFEEIIKQALAKKEEIAQKFISLINNYGRDYSYYTLIVDFRQDSLNSEIYLNFLVELENENAYVTGFNLRLMIFCKEGYSYDEITKDLIIKLLEEELQKLESMTQSTSQK